MMQFLRSFTCDRRNSYKEFTAKVGTVLEEADEAEGCLDTIWDAGLCTTDEAKRLRVESKELRSIFAKAANTAERNERTAASNRRSDRKR